jgi:hypothetical protein
VAAATPAYYFYRLDEHNTRNVRWTVELAQSAIATKLGPGAEVSLQQAGDNEFIGTLKQQNDYTYKLGFRDGITYKLRVRVVANGLEYEGDNHAGATMGGGVGPSQPSFYKAHPLFARYVYGVGFCIFVLGASYPALRVFGWRRKYAGSRERLLWACGFINLCFAVLEGYCFVALP